MYDILVSTVYKLVRRGIPMNQAIRDTANCNDVNVTDLARHMQKRSTSVKRAKKNNDSQ